MPCLHNVPSSPCAELRYFRKVGTARAAPNLQQVASEGVKPGLPRVLYDPGR